MTGATRARFAAAMALLGCAACAGGIAASASDARSSSASSDPTVRIARALSAAGEASMQEDKPRLASALALLDRAGARPAGDWQGPDPVPGWREKLGKTAQRLRGSPLGPGYRCGQLDAGGSDRFDQVFLSGRRAKVALSAPGNAPLALRVLDAERKPVCAGDNTRQACNWVPIFTQRYTIEVVNPGKRNADYFLVVD